MPTTQGVLTIERFISPGLYVFSLLNSVQGSAGVTIAAAITSPAAAASLTQGVPVSVAVTTTTAASGVVFKVNGTAVAAMAGSGTSWSYSWTPLAGDIGSPSLTAVATDLSSGSVGTSAAVVVSVASGLAPVATRSRVASSAALGTTAYMCRIATYSRDTLAAVQVAWPNWRVVNTNGGETGCGGVITIKASIEYPAGTFTQIKFAGSATGTIPNATTLLSDAAVVAIPIGAKFWIRWSWVSTVNLPVITGINYKDTFAGDAFQATATDLTMSGTVTDDAGSNAMRPVAILGTTTRKTLALLGDSRVAGQGDSVVNDYYGDMGELERPFGPAFAYLNLASFGESSSGFLASNTLRRALANYCTTIISEYGVNDTGTGVSAATVQTNQASIAALFPGKPVWLCTLPPTSTGAWTAVDLSDQTVGTFDAARVTYNTWVRTSPAGFAGFFDCAAVGESSLNSGKWKANGVALAYTVDGVHESGKTNLLSALAFPTAAFNGNFSSLFEWGVVQSVQTDIGAVYGATMRLTGTSTSVQTLSGTITGALVPVRTKCTTAGAIGSGALYSVYYDGGTTAAMTGVAPSVGTPVALTGAGAGLSITWAAGSGVLNDVSDATLSSWGTDQAGAPAMLQATASAQPVVTAGVNGVAGFKTDGSTQRLGSSLNLPAPLTTPTWRGLVYRNLTLASTKELMGDTTGVGHVLQQSATDVSMYNGVFGNAIIGPSAGTWECDEASYTGTIWDYLRRGPVTQQPFTGSVGNNASTGVFFGAYGGGGFASVEGEHLIQLNRVPSNGEIARWRAAVAAKYGGTVQV